MTCGHDSAPPHLFFFAVDILFDNKAASWVDATLAVWLIIANWKSSTNEQVLDLKDQCTAKFSLEFVDTSEWNLKNDTKNFAQKELEPLIAYYQSVVYLLRRTHSRDAPRNIITSRPLALIEQSALNILITAFLDWLYDEDLRCQVFSRSALSSELLWKCVDFAEEVQQGLDTARKGKERES